MAASDALCTALQIINHLQDCGKDYRELDRVYVPLQDMAAHGVNVRAFAEPKASPELLACIRAVATRTCAALFLKHRFYPAALPMCVSALKLQS